MSEQDRLQRKNQFDGNLAVSVGDFNRQTGRDHHMARREVKENELMDSATGLVVADLTVERACPLCERMEADALFVKKGFRHVRCRQCSMVYVAPVLKEERLNTYYLNEDSWVSLQSNVQQQRFDRLKFDYGLDLIEAYTQPPGELVDVGCGYGLFMEEAKKRAWHVTGVEFNQVAVQKLRERGFDVIDKPMNQANLPEAFADVVSLWAVLEHIMEPKNFMVECRRILKLGGVLLLTVPNIDSLANRILHEKSVAFSGENHVNLFSPRTLTAFLEDLDFEVVSVETFLTEIGTIRNFLNYDDPYYGPGTPVLDVLTPEYIHRNLLGKMLLIMARRKSL